MGVLSTLRERRLIQFFGAYLATGFLALEGVDQLVSHAILPELAYTLTLVFYSAGVPATFIVAWFHGARGAQKMPRAEIWLLSGVGLVALAISGVVVRNHLAARALAIKAEASMLDPARVAVLYFENLSENHELGYVGDGFTEALIDQLSAVRALDVISRNGVAPYRESEIPRDSIARALNAGSLIAGSVEEVGDRLRVTARLVDGTSGADIERTSFELPAGELLAARDSVAQRVSRFLRQRLGEEIRVRERRAETANVAAWALVQRAERTRKEAEALAREDLHAAYEEFIRADSLLALAELADSLWVEPTMLRGHIALSWSLRLGGEPDEAVEWIETGLDHANRALELSHNNPKALEVRGTLTYWHWFLNVTPDPEERAKLLSAAREDLEAAVQADPTLASVYSTLSHLYYHTADNVSVILAARRAYEEDAYLANADQILSRLFFASYDLAQFTEAQRWCDEGARRFPTDYRFAECQLWVMITPVVDPDVDRAWQLLATLDTLTPPERRAFEQHLAQMMLGGVIGRAGLTDSARSVLVGARTDREIDPDQELFGYEAVMRAVIGDYDEAVALLQRYVAANPHHSFEVEGDLHWWWRPLRDHPGFQAVAARTR